MWVHGSPTGGDLEGAACTNALKLPSMILLYALEKQSMQMAVITWFMAQAVFNTILPKNRC